MTDLLWEGCCNVRDLGGLPTTDDRRTRLGALVRSDSPTALTEAGWAALHAYGVRTVVDLTEHHEQRPDTATRPADLVTVHVPLDGTDEDFWAPLRHNDWWGTALYYPAFLARYPERVAEVARAIAAAPPGGVLMHCGRGRDRTGLMSLVLLSLVGVEPTGIVADYLRSNSAPVVARRVALGLTDDTVTTGEIYRRHGRDEVDVLARLVDAVDGVTILRAGGLDDHEVAQIRDRLLAN